MNRIKLMFAESCGKENPVNPAKRKNRESPQEFWDIIKKEGKLLCYTIEGTFIKKRLDKFKISFIYVYEEVEKKSIMKMALLKKEV